MQAKKLVYNNTVCRNSRLILIEDSSYKQFFLKQLSKGKTSVKTKSYRSPVLKKIFTKDFLIALPAVVLFLVFKLML